MIPSQPQKIRTLPTTRNDLDEVLRLFRMAMEPREDPRYRAWNEVDEAAVARETENGLRYKVVDGSQLLGVFSVQYSDPYIWRERDRNDAVYLHRIVANRDRPDGKFFPLVLSWAILHAQEKKRPCLRMDTWAGNQKLTSYYTSHGFSIAGVHTTPDVAALPVQNRNLEVVLLELHVPGASIINTGQI